MHVVVREYRTSFLRRMWNSSEFMRTYKQHFTMSFNARRDHHGTMFEGRYHERNHKPEKPVMWRTAAYVDINAWSAGIVKKAENYEWCSFAAAARGRQEGATRLCLHVRQRRLGDDSRLPREVDARGDGRGDGRARAGEGGARDEGPRRLVRSKGSVAFEGGSGAQGAEGLFGQAGARLHVKRKKRRP